MLRTTGFSRVDHAINDFVDSSKYMMSVMLSQAVDDNVMILQHPPKYPNTAAGKTS